MNLFTSLGFGALLFASTDVDDLFFLMAFFAAPGFRVGNVVVGQYLGIGALIAVSLLASLISLIVNPAYVGLLGALPILMGAVRLVGLGRNDDHGIDGPKPVPDKRPVAQILTVFSVTVASGGDNLSAYIPLFSTQTVAQTLAVTTAMLVMTGVWLAAAHWLANHRAIGAPIRRYSPRVVPFVLIALGVYVLYRAGSLQLLWPR